MESVAEQMISLLIENCKNDDVRRGMEIALEIIENSGYHNLYDWEEMDDSEKLEELEEYLNIIN